jgi:hypothetical protein
MGQGMMIEEDSELCSDRPGFEKGCQYAEPFGENWDAISRTSLQVGRWDVRAGFGKSLQDGNPLSSQSSMI